MGVIAEKFADDDGLVWPASVAPFQYYLVAIGEEGQRVADEIYAAHPDEILYDDRDLRIGTKFADADLIGLPKRIVISDKTLATGSAELTDRKTHTSNLVKLSDLQFGTC